MTPDSGATAPPVTAAGPPPALLRRMTCFVYEATLLFGIALVPAVLGTLFFAQTGQSHPLQSEGVVRAFALVVYGIYFVGCWSVRGQTLAMQTWRIRVVAVDGGRLARGGRWPDMSPAASPGSRRRPLWPPPSVSVPGRRSSPSSSGSPSTRCSRSPRPGRQFWHDIVCGTRLVDTRGEPVASP